MPTQGSYSTFFVDVIFEEDVPVPNLYIALINPTLKNIYGQEVVVVRVCTNGAATAASSTLRYWHWMAPLSGGSGWWKVQTTYSTPSLGVGGCYDHVVVDDSAIGYHEYHVWTDVYDVVYESNENDNYAVGVYNRQFWPPPATPFPRAGLPVQVRTARPTGMAILLEIAYIQNAGPTSPLTAGDAVPARSSSHASRSSPRGPPCAPVNPPRPVPPNPPAARAAMRAVLPLLLALAAVPAAPGAARSQSPAPPGAVAEASRLRDARELAAAAELLERHLAAHPDDADAARMLAQTLYWTGDRAAAGARYEEALRRWPEDPWLRLDYGRMLVETGRGGRAAEVLEPLRGGGPAAAGAEALLATAAYWRGDLTAAARGFRRALRLEPDHAEALRQLGEIRALAAPWVRVGAVHRRDTQPLERSAFSVEAGWHPTPLRALAARVEPQHFGAAGGSDAFSAEASLRDYRPALRTELEAAAGIVRRGAGLGDEWTGRLGLGVRLPRGAVVRGAAERAPYFWTVGSLAEPTFTEAVSAALAWDDPAGWMGEAGYALQRFPDDNLLASAHVWLLAPLVRAGGARLSAGYAFGIQDAAESRWVPSAAAGEGVYHPYYTPEMARAHSAVAALALPLGGAARLSVDGSYGFHARERAPALAPTEGAASAERGFTPWRARGALSAGAGPGVTLALEGERSRTAFYTLTTVGAGATWRFLPRAARR